MTHTVPVSGVAHLPEGMLLLQVDTTGTPLPERYEHVGQFVTLSTGESPPGYFAMASAPRESRFEFLIKVETDKPKTAELAKLQVGDKVVVSDVEGVGYPLREQSGRDLLLVATGTGIAPIRALVGEIDPIRARYGEITLVYGASKRIALAFPGDHDRWRAKGIHFVPCLSRPEPDWTGARGYVQDIVPAVVSHPEKTTAFLCGQKTMTHRVAHLLAAQGLPAERIFENY
jgi:NAD(P)H-flavin reductase